MSGAPPARCRTARRRGGPTPASEQGDPRNPGTGRRARPGTPRPAAERPAGRDHEDVAADRAASRAAGGKGRHRRRRRRRRRPGRASGRSVGRWVGRVPPGGDLPPAGRARRGADRGAAGEGTRRPRGRPRFRGHERRSRRRRRTGARDRRPRAERDWPARGKLATTTKAARGRRGMQY